MASKKKIRQASAPGKASEAEADEALGQVNTWLARHARGRGSTERDDLASAAIEIWLEGAGTPAQCAKRVTLDAARKAKRRKTTASDKLDDRGTGKEDDTVEFLDAKRSGFQPKKRVRKRRFGPNELEALKSAVRIECLKQFEKRIGVDWDPRWEAHVLTDQFPVKDWQEGLRVHEELRQAMVAAVAFVRKERPRLRNVPHGLGWWVPEHIEPLLKHAFMKQRQDDSVVKSRELRESARHRLVATWDSYDMMHLPPRGDGSPRILDATEYAIVWLLGGGWPEGLSVPKAGLTASEVIQREARTFRTAIKEAGRDWPHRGGP